MPNLIKKYWTVSRLSKLDPASKHITQFKKFLQQYNCYNLIPSCFFCNILIKALKGPVYVQNALSQTHDGGGAATTARHCDGNSSESETDRQSSRYSMEEVV